MSELINNATQRKQILKNVLRQLHEGKSVEEVKAEFGDLASQVDSAEIAGIEQALIDEGLPVEEIQNLCDVHVAVFRDGLNEQRTPESIPGHPIHTFSAENKAALRLIAQMQQAFRVFSPEAGTAENATYSGTPLQRQMIALQLERLTGFDVHYLRKENLLFPFMEQYGFQGPAKVMWGIHDTIRAEWENLRAKLENEPPSQAAAAFTGIAQAMQEMIYKEEKILFPAALQTLSENNWGAIQSQEEEIGFFMVTPGSEWQPAILAMHAEPKAEPAALAANAAQSVETDGLLSLSTGLLSPEQLNLMLTHLPVDITFVDENDTVRYFSQARERIFTRSPAIIGRKVQNCHPPQSVGRVQKILDDFREGRRDAAEFWIQMGEKFVLIRYFAMRDEQRNYRGTIEVTQDIAPLRALQGERRLLDEAAG